MTEFQIREHMCEIGRRLYAKGFAAANDGNITYRLNDKEILCTPTMISKGYMKPDDICKVDYDGKQLAGTKKRTSEVLLHLVVYKLNPKVNAVVHCHPPHATAFAVAHEPIPKCVLPEVEVFLGEIPIAKYETPGNQKFADTIAPYVKDSNTILLANHGTITFGPTLDNAYFNTEIIDAYCRILILAKQLGRVNYFDEGQTRELLEFKKRLGYEDVRFNDATAPMCGLSSFDESYSDFVPEAYAFQHECAPATNACRTRGALPANMDVDELVQVITERVMESLAGAGVS